MSREEGHSREAELSALNAEKEGLLLRLKQVDEKIRQLENVGDETKQDESEPKQEKPDAEIIKQLGLGWFFKLNLDEIRKSGLPPELEEKFDGQVGLIRHLIDGASKPSTTEQERIDKLNLKEHLASLKKQMEMEFLDKRNVADTLLPGAEWESEGVQRITRRFENGSPAIIWRVKKVANHPYNVEIAVEIVAGARRSEINSDLDEYFDIPEFRLFVQHMIEPAIFVISGKPFTQLNYLADGFVRGGGKPGIYIGREHLVKKGKLDCTPVQKA